MVIMDEHDKNIVHKMILMLIGALIIGIIILVLGFAFIVSDAS